MRCLIISILIMVSCSGCMISSSYNKTDGFSFGAKGLVPLPQTWKDGFDKMMKINDEE